MTDTIKLSTVYPDGDDAYVDENSAAALEDLPVSAWAALVEACDELMLGDSPGIDCHVAKTHDTLADFDESRRKHWTEAGTRSDLTLAGLPAIMYERAQLFRGHQRETLIVIDCGNCRAVVT